MDSTTAALVGAAIGGGSTLVVAIVGPLLASRMTTRVQRRREIREEIARVLSSCLALLNARRAGSLDGPGLHAEMVTATTRLAILLGPRDGDVERALAFAVKAVTNNDHIQAGYAATDALRATLHEWYRGEAQGKRIGDRYGKHLDDALRSDRD